MSAGGRRPVVFMGLPMAINVRDVLRTDAFRVLRDAGAEIHLFTPAADVPEFRAEFAGPTVHLHPLAAPSCTCCSCRCARTPPGS
jgi:hypothetical protein